MENTKEETQQEETRASKNRSEQTPTRNEHRRTTQKSSLFRIGERIFKKTRALGTIQRDEVLKIVSKGKEIGISVQQTCQFMQMRRSSYYYKLKHQGDKFLKDKESLKIIKKIFIDQKEKAGIRTIYMILKNKYKIKMNLKKIARIKKEYGLITKIRKKNPYHVQFKKGLEHRTAPNLLKQQFKATKPDRVYSTDISYLIYKGGKRAYLSATKDLATREIVAFNLNKDLSLQTAFNGLEKTLKQKDCSKLIIHSDQGWHYTHPLYVKKLKELGVKQSMSRKGNCLDNAPIESFFGHLKDDIDIKSCTSFEEVKSLVENYIFYYNNNRYQWSLKKMTPAQCRCHLLSSP